METHLEHFTIKVGLSIKMFTGQARAPLQRLLT